MRHVAPTQPDLIARKVREAQGHLYAHTRFLRRFGPVETREDLARADFISMGEDEELVRKLKRTARRHQR